MIVSYYFILLLDAVILVCAFRKMRHAHLADWHFLFYFIFTMVYFFAVIGDLDPLSDALSFGDIAAFSNSELTLIVKLGIALAFIYANFHVNYRKKAIM